MESSDSEETKHQNYTTQSNVYNDTSTKKSNFGQTKLHCITLSSYHSVFRLPPSEERNNEERGYRI